MVGLGLLSKYYMDFRLARRFHQKQKALNDFVCKKQFVTDATFSPSAYKSSDTVFILGSGSSINCISGEQWEHIDAHDTIGFNNWTLHPYVPTYYFFEPTSLKNESQKRMNQQIYNNLSVRSRDYNKVAVIMHYLERYFFDYGVLQAFDKNDNLYFQSPVNVPGDSLVELDMAYQRAFERGYFNSVNKSVYRRGSVAKIIHFAVACGYKKVVLLGVDLNTSPYFFDEPGIKLPEGCVDLSFTKKTHFEQVHDTVNTDIHSITMLDVIKIVQKNIFCNMGIKLFNGSELSALRSELPCYWHES